MRLTLLGVRGSTPAPGPQFVRYGGHTSCIAVAGDGDAAPGLVLDAGTGIRSLPRLLGPAPFRGSVVLTHMHWDHVQGLPFCPSVDRPDAAVDVFVPLDPSRAADGTVAGTVDGTVDGRRDGEALRTLTRFMSPPHFPIGPEGLQGSWRIRAALPGVLAVGAALVTVAPALHKGGATIGIRVDLDGGSMAYLPDHALTQTAPAGAEPHGATTLEALVDGVDVLLHDGQFLPGERTLATAYGHATVDAVMALADRCGVGRLVLTHHAPTRTDDALDLLAGTVTATPGGRPVTIARQDDVLHVAGAVPDAATAAATGAAAPATPPRHDR